MKKSIRIVLFTLIFLSIFVLTLACQALGSDWTPGPKPNLLTITSWPIDTSNYMVLQHYFGILSAQEKVEGRSVALGQTLSRHAMAKDGTADAVFNDPAPFFYFYGLAEVSDMSWGPQQIRRLLVLSDEPTFDSMFTSDPENIKSTRDLKGKKIGRVEGSTVYNFETLSYLATAGLYQDDVILVPYPSISALIEGFIRKEVDVIRVQNPAPPAVKFEASPVGAHLVPIPDDPQAEKNLRMHDPLGVNWISTYNHKGGYGTLPDGTKPGPDNPYPSLGHCTTLTCYAQTDKNKAYWIIKLLTDNYDELMKNPPLYGQQTQGIALEKQLDPKTPNCIPWHEGAIEYLKEVGVWTKEMEDHNQVLLQREQDLQKKWGEVVAEAKKQGISGKDFEEMWTGEVDKLMVLWGIK